MAALATAYSIVVLLVAVLGVATIMWVTPRGTGREGTYSGAMTTLAVAVFLVALVGTIAF